MNEFMTFLYTIIGTAFGAFLTALIQWWDNRPKLGFELIGAGNVLNPEVDEEGNTELAYLAIEVFNSGKGPAVLTCTFRISYGKRKKYQAVCDLDWEDDERVIMPYEKKIHYLEMQDIKNMIYFDEKAGIEEFDITAYQIGKRNPIKAKLDVGPLPGHLTRHAAEEALMQ